MTPNTRRPTESFVAYKFRMKVEAMKLKAFRRGRMVWNSTEKGTYVRAKHGEIGA